MNKQLKFFIVTTLIFVSSQSSLLHPFHPLYSQDSQNPLNSQSSLDSSDTVPLYNVLNDVTVYLRRVFLPVDPFMSIRFIMEMRLTAFLEWFKLTFGAHRLGYFNNNKSLGGNLLSVYNRVIEHSGWEEFELLNDGVSVKETVRILNAFL